MSSEPSYSTSKAIGDGLAILALLVLCIALSPVLACVFVGALVLFALAVFAGMLH